LSQLQRRGGKLIVYHGWNDPSIPPMNSVDYYESVCRCWRRAKPRGRAGKNADVFPALHGAGHDALLRRTGHGPLRHADGARGLGRKDVPPARIVASTRPTEKSIAPGRSARIRRSRHIPEAAAPDDAANFVCRAARP